MDNQFNTKLQSWLNDDSRTIEDGCLLLLQMENNQIHYQNLLRHPNKVAVMKYLVSELQKRLTVRLANITHKEVAEMDEQVKVIVKEHFSYQEAKTEGTSNEEFRKGKRADHDQLPEEIQARYVENLDLLRRMREVHLKLRSLSTEQVSCPDSERYPFLKELIALDKQLHENWNVYDHYVVDETVTAPAPSTSPESSVVNGSAVESHQPVETSTSQPAKTTKATKPKITNTSKAKK